MRSHKMCPESCFLLLVYQYPNIFCCCIVHIFDRGSEVPRSPPDIRPVRIRNPRGRLDLSRGYHLGLVVYLTLTHDDEIIRSFVEMKLL